MIKEITSPQNEQFKYWKSLLKSKGLRDGEHFLVSGSKLVNEILQDRQWLQRIQYALSTKDQQSLLSSSLSGMKSTVLTKELFEELDVLGTKFPILIVQQPLIETWNFGGPPAGLEILCPFGDPQNVGALVRSAYAFGASKVILLKEAAHPLLPKSIKASSGAILKMPLLLGPNINNLPAGVIALDLNGTPLTKKQWPKDLRLLIGEEGQGIPSSFSGERITLSMTNPMESLNAAVAAGIVIHHLTQL